MAKETPELCLDLTPKSTSVTTVFTSLSIHARNTQVVSHPNSKRLWKSFLTQKNCCNVKSVNAI